MKFTLFITFWLSAVAFGEEPIRGQGVAPGLDKKVNNEQMASLRPLYDQELKEKLDPKSQQYDRHLKSVYDDLAQRGFGSSYTLGETRPEKLLPYISKLRAEISKRTHSFIVKDLEKVENISVGWLIELHQIYVALIQLEKSCEYPQELHMNIPAHVKLKELLDQRRARLSQLSIVVSMSDTDSIHTEKNSAGQTLVKINFSGGLSTQKVREHVSYSYLFGRPQTEQNLFRLRRLGENNEVEIGTLHLVVQLNDQNRTTSSYIPERHEQSTLLNHERLAREIGAAISR